MGFRIINIRSRVKLEHRLNYLVIRGETEKKIHISEINTLILQSTAVSLTASLLAVLVENNVKVIFCDKKCNPVSELMPYYGTHNSSGRLAEQINWDKSVKDDVWQEIVQRKKFLKPSIFPISGSRAKAICCCVTSMTLNPAI